MRHKERLFAIAAFAVAGLGWLAWKPGPEPAARYAFEFDAIVDTEWVAFRSIVGCYPFEAEFMGKTRTVYGLRERLFAKELKSGKTFYVAIPNACSDAVKGDHPQSGQERPTLAEARAVTPLSFVTDGSREPETVRLFTSLRGPSEPDDQPLIMTSVIRPLDETNETLHERFGEPDPLARADGWTSVVFVPISNAPQLEQGWIEDRWHAGACQIARLNAQGRTAVDAFDPGGRIIKLFWPQVWDGVPLTDITLKWNLDEAQGAAVRDTLDLVIPAVPTWKGFEIRPHQRGIVDLFHADSERQRMSTRASAYFFNGIQLATEDGQADLPFVIQCPAERRLYVPAHFVFLRMKPL